MSVVKQRLDEMGETVRAALDAFDELQKYGKPGRERDKELERLNLLLWELLPKYELLIDLHKLEQQEQRYSS